MLWIFNALRSMLGLMIVKRILKLSKIFAMRLLLLAVEEYFNLKSKIMSQENLYNDKARKKLKEMVDNIDFAMMETGLGKRPTHIIPMSTKKIDDDGQLWFLSNDSSEHNANIRGDGYLQLIYSDPNEMEFLTIYGTAEISKEKKVLEELYGKADDTWFDGVDDPNLSAIRVQPKEAHYWDTQSGKFITLFKIGLGAISGKKQDIGKEGDLHLNSEV